MTRRAEAEAMIARYGGGVAYGGETFAAFLRPAHFQSGGNGSLPETSARWTYVGPAAHKLSVGGTVTDADGAEFSVLRCETVRLGGEEIYVRAVLAPITLSGGAEILLERDGKTIARAEACEAEAVQDADAMIPWGESAPAAVLEGAVRWALSLSGVIPESGEDLSSTAAFQVTVSRGGLKTVYSGCRWKTFRDAEDVLQGRSRALEALASGRTEEAASDG